MDKLELYEKICDRLDCELDDYFHKQIVNAPSMNLQDAEIIDLILHSLKSIKTIMAMEGYEEPTEYSGSRYMPNTYSGTRNYSGRNYSGRRDSMGRYSRDSEKEEMMHKLDTMMQNAKTEEEAMALRSTMDALARVK